MSARRINSAQGKRILERADRRAEEIYSHGKRESRVRIAGGIGGRWIARKLRPELVRAGQEAATLQWIARFFPNRIDFLAGVHRSANDEYLLQHARGPQSEHARDIIQTQSQYRALVSDAAAFVQTEAFLQQHGKIPIGNIKTIFSLNAAQKPVIKYRSVEFDLIPNSKPKSELMSIISDLHQNRLPQMYQREWIKQPPSFGAQIAFATLLPAQLLQFHRMRVWIGRFIDNAQDAHTRIYRKSISSSTRQQLLQRLWNTYCRERKLDAQTKQHVLELFARFQPA